MNVTMYHLSKRDAIGDRASAGWLLKWKIGNIWIKSPGYLMDFLWDSYAEVIASAVAKDIGIKNHVDYRLCLIDLDGRLVVGCESEDYNKPNMKEYTFKKLMDMKELKAERYWGYKGYMQLIDEVKKRYNVDIQGYLEDTIVLDSIILNTDRNLWNLSLLITRIIEGRGENGQIKKRYQGSICKIYDSGSSLGLTTYHTGEFYEEAMYCNGYGAAPFDGKYEEQLKYVRNNRVYGGKLERTSELLTTIRQNFSVENNMFGILNPMENGQIDYIVDLLRKRYRTVIVNKGWQN